MNHSQTNRHKKRSRRGFVQASSLMKGDIRSATQTRGFGQTRLLTHWSEIAGEATAAISRPVKISYSQKGMGATLILLCRGADAPMLQMQLPQILTRVNSTFGYKAISRIRLTQTAADGLATDGFQEPAGAFARKSAAPPKPLAQATKARIDALGDDRLKQALTALGENVMSRTTNRKG